MNTMWVFEYIEELTDRYHSGGGLIVVAKNITEAKKLVAGAGENIEVENWSEAKRAKTEFDPQVWLFPDAGCC